jgi:hypothetical protein
MRPSRHVDAESFRPPPPEAADASGLPGICRARPVNMPGPAGPVSSPMPASGPLCDRIRSQPNVPVLWLGRLIAEGETGDLISMVHRQQAWLELLRARTGRG